MKVDLAKIRQRLRHLIRLNNSPHEIALGVAVGVFIAILPLYGLHTAMVVAAAVLIRRINKIAILAGTNISTVITFPFITSVGYSIGCFFLKDNYEKLSWQAFRNFDYKVLWGIYVPLFAGSFVLGVALALWFYFLIRIFFYLRALKQEKLVCKNA